MYTTHHHLVDEFPELKDKIHQLIETNSYFKRLYKDYEGLEKEIYNIEVNNINTSDKRFEELKKKRLSIKDSLYSILKESI